MKLSEQWLREWVDPPIDTEALVNQLTTSGLEVSAWEPVCGMLQRVVVGEVVSVAPHPNADRLRLCEVDVGEEALLPIVCGAPNVRIGMRAPTAQVGARLNDGTEIKEAQVRGTVSRGMLCSAHELGLAESAEGLLELPHDAPLGADLVTYLGLEDVSLDLDLTPNRGDCLSVAGVARELGALNREPLRAPVIGPVPATVQDTVPIVLESPADCPHYVGRIVRNIDPEASTPLWMQERLRRSGLRSISAVVDVTNYVMLELGQPMHAFDLAKLVRGINVRRARTKETLQLLDGNRVDLDEAAS
jgi:phenylalanyl-tRNA synthetase beta chain